MAYQDIFEPIEMIAIFERGKLRPLRFRWQGRVYKINQVYSSWSMREGAGQQHYFSVGTDDENCFELIFNNSNFNWQLARVYIEG